MRLQGYAERKAYIIRVLENELVVLENKKRYIEELLAGTLDLRKKKKTEIVQLLKSKKYAVIANEEEYKYLLKMPMDSVSYENVDKIRGDYEKKLSELNYYKTTSEKEFWIEELKLLKEQFMLYVDRREEQNS